MRNSSIKNKGYVLVATVVIILLWQGLAMVIDHEVLVPMPTKTLLEVLNIVKGDTFLLIIMSTLKRVIAGFGLALILALILGLLSVIIKPVYFLLKPVILIQKSVPTMAIILLAIIWLNAERAPILVGFLIIFPIIYYAVVDGIQGIDQQLLEMAKVYQLSMGTKIKKIYLPSLRNSLISVTSTALGLNLKITIAAEVLSQPSYAIGTSFQIEKAMLNTAGVFAWAFIAITLAGLFDVFLSIIFKTKKL